MKRSTRLESRSLGDVPKWSKGTVCKTVIHGFESHRHLTSPAPRANRAIAGYVMASLIFPLLQAGEVTTP